MRALFSLFRNAFLFSPPEKNEGVGVTNGPNLAPFNRTTLYLRPNPSPSMGQYNSSILWDYHMIYPSLCREWCSINGSEFHEFHFWPTPPVCARFTQHISPSSNPPLLSIFPSREREPYLLPLSCLIVEWEAGKEEKACAIACMAFEVRISRNILLCLISWYKWWVRYQLKVAPYVLLNEVKMNSHLQCVAQSQSGRGLVRAAWHAKQPSSSLDLISKL